MLDIEVPIQMDVSGHLVIAIDQFPDDGWPPGLTTKVDLYPGEAFAAGRPQDQHADQPNAKRVKRKERECPSPTATSPKPYFIPNFTHMSPITQHEH